MRILTALRLTLLLALIAALFAACAHDPNVRKQKYFESGESYFDKGKFEEAAIESQVRNRFAETEQQIRDGIRADPKNPTSSQHPAVARISNSETIMRGSAVAWSVMVRHWSV